MQHQLHAWHSADSQRALQLIGHEQRGFAWTRALLGVKAKEIHVCGDPSALGLLGTLTGIMNEPLDVRHYNRLKPLVVSSTDPCLNMGGCACD